METVVAFNTEVNKIAFLLVGHGQYRVYIYMHNMRKLGDSFIHIGVYGYVFNVPSYMGLIYLCGRALCKAKYIANKSIRLVGINEQPKRWLK